MAAVRRGALALLALCLVAGAVASAAPAHDPSSSQGAPKKRCCAAHMRSAAWCVLYCVMSSTPFSLCPMPGRVRALPALTNSPLPSRLQLPLLPAARRLLQVGAASPSPAVATETTAPAASPTTTTAAETVPAASPSTGANETAAPTAGAGNETAAAGNATGGAILIAEVVPAVRVTPGVVVRPVAVLLP